MRYQQVFPLPVAVQETDRLLAESVARWAERELFAKRTTLRESYDKLYIPARKALVEEIGMIDLMVGLADDNGALMTVVTALEQVGRADTGLAYQLANTAAVCRAAGKQARSLLSDQAPIAALILPGFGDASRNATTDWAFAGLCAQVQLEPSKDAWVLSGKRVRPQCSGFDADRFGVVGEIDREPALVWVSAGEQGIGRSEPLVATGLAASKNADLSFDGVKVDRSQVLFRGAEPYRELLAWYRLSCAAAATGAMLTSWEILSDWCDSRVIKGKGQKFRDNPLVAALLGTIGERIGTGRLLLYGTAQLLSNEEADAAAAFAAATAATSTVFVAARDVLDHTMELMGSAGYATEWNLERYWRDIKTVETYLALGTAGKMDLARHYWGCEIL